MTDDEIRVANLIHSAFRGVVLGNGVGLMQAQGLDDYADDETLARYRAADEKADWTAIPVEALDDCYSSLSFFDAEGMRFHLPAFLLADLEGTYQQDVVNLLVDEGHYNRSRFTLLSDSQRDAVRQYLLLQLANGFNERWWVDFEAPSIRRALETYWGRE
jgi:hypothetical protein